MESIERIYEGAQGCNLSEPYFASIDDDLSFLSDYFRTSKRQAFFVALAVPFHFTSFCTTLSELISYCDCNPAKVLTYSDDLCHLFSLRFFEMSRKNAGFRMIRSIVVLQLNEKLLTAIVHNQPLPEVLADPFPRSMELLKFMHNQILSENDDEVSLSDLYAFVQMLLSDYSHFQIVKKIRMFFLPEAGRIPLTEE